MKTKKHSREIAVLSAAIKQISTPEGFTTSMYLRRKGTVSGFYMQQPGPDVVATCAVGGIEQAVWKITGEAPAVVNDHRPASRQSLFGRVLGKCNRITREKFGNVPELAADYTRRELDIERLTFVGDDETARKRVLQVLRAAKREYVEAARA